MYVQHHAHHERDNVALEHVVDVFLKSGFVTEITTVETTATNKIVVSVYDSYHSVAR